MPPGVRLVDVETDRGRPKSRVCMMDLDMPAAGIVFTHNNSIPNLLRGIGERLMLVPKGDEFVLPPKPAEGVYSPGSSMADYAAAVCRKMPKMDGPLERDEFVALYDGPKRKRYEAAAASLLNRELTKEDWEINVFIKDETVCSWTKNDPAPRIISPRSPEYCMEVGRFIKPIEHLLYKAVARVWGETTIAKGLNFNQRGQLIYEKWSSFSRPVAVGLDASRFDQHVSTEALTWEHGIYQACYPHQGRSKLKWLLSKQLVNSGRAYLDGKKLEYSREGGRMSGDMNTALGNCLIMTGLVWSYLSEKNIIGKLINDGDDCVVFMEEEDLDLFMSGLSPWFTKRGFTMKVETPVTVLEEIEFCQCHPVWNGEQYTMCRNVHKALYTDVAHVGRRPEEIADIRKSIGVGGQCWAKGIPVLSAFYHKLAQGPGKSIVLRNSGTYWNAKGCVTGTSVCTDAARLSFAKAFGISPEEQGAIEQYYEGITTRPFDVPTQMLTYEPVIPSDQYPLYISEALNTIVLNKYD
jgi:hypothetical protein